MFLNFMTQQMVVGFLTHIQILIGKQTAYMQNVDEHILVLLLDVTISKENIYVLTIILATRSVTKKAIKYN